MVDTVQINQFTQSGIEDTDILHTKKSSGEDRKTTFADVKSQVIAAIPASQDFNDYTSTSTLSNSDIFAVQTEFGDPAVYNKITYSALKTLMVNTMYPVGSYYFNYSSSTSPSTLLGAGTWVRVRGRFIVGEGSGTDINGYSQSFTAQTTGGEHRHTLSVSEMPSHRHGLSGNAGGSGFVTTNDGAGNAGYTDYQGGGSPHNNVPTYEVAYIWRRTA